MGIARLNIRIGGFTLIEMVVTILIMGILSAYVLPKIDLSSFRETGFVQQAKATIRMGQKLAITSGCEVDVFIDSSTCTLTWNAGSACTGTPISNPATGDANFCTDSSPAGNPSANFTFDKIGGPTAAVPQIDFGGGRTVDVESNTGFVHE